MSTIESVHWGQILHSRGNVTVEIAGPVQPGSIVTVRALRTIDDLAVEDRRVLVRADFNVPLGPDASGATAVPDDMRIRSALPTIEEVRRRRGRLALSGIAR